MTTLLLVRHGQASFGSGDYDRLCPMGFQQSELLGAHLAREGRRIDAAVKGTLRRQDETARTALNAAGWECPVTADAAFDEYPSDALFAAYLPILAARRPDIAGASIDELRHDRRLFQSALSGVLALWLDGAEGFSGESWLAFAARVRGGLERAVAEHGKDDTVAVFTSGGVIGCAVATVLGLVPESGMALSWRVHNASVTEIRYGRSGFALAGFNGVSHLRLAGGETLLTYR
ncbi:histidine phosphatase family protein [Azospirillum agricola]|uniref:histidine phosphatase family protein n=1 Tax=Azospirillum agricola TaxID=1720247 RepID=UPI000A0F05DD|nr:histidine phosphatase family protein [Azospirillum agricola]SMH62786.1 Broad specificity phosphatase PhoE [Azospirillum lipoferum]